LAIAPSETKPEDYLMKPSAAHAQQAAAAGQAPRTGSTETPRGSQKARYTPWFEIRKPIPSHRVIGLGIAVWALFFGIWELIVVAGMASPLLVPTPQKVLLALYDLVVNQGFLWDVGISIYRIVLSFGVACLIAIPLGILMGVFPTVEAFVNAFVSPWRYLPAPSFIPILLMWLGTGDAPKITLLIIGVVFFLITLIMDHTRAVRQELLETAMTLGGNRRQIVGTVVVPAVMPSVLTAMRQMLAVSWTYLVIAEIVASTTGIGAMMMRAKRFLHTDQIMAGIVVIGILGLLFDLLFRRAHRFFFPYIDQ
jgi:NitT/TauT family transport system permease protein